MTQKRKLENNFTSTLHILLVLHRWVGGAFQEMADGKTKSETLHKPDDLIPPSPHLARLPAMCEKNVFHFFRSSASGKLHVKCLVTLMLIPVFNFQPYLLV